MAYIGPEPNPGQNREVDDISSSFNGNTTAFTLQVNSQNVSPGSANAIIVSLGGVIQNPGTDYTVAASTLTFTTAPASGLSFFGLVLGQQVDIQSLADGTSPTMSAPSITGDLSIADKIVHTGDTNTAIRFPAADTVTFETAGSERLRITADGPHLLLGGTADVNEITESSANAGMVIGGTGFGNAGLAIITSNSGTGRLYFGDNTGSDAGRNRGQINYGHSDNHMRFVTNSSERMRIRNDGLVTIATSSNLINESGLGVRSAGNTCVLKAEGAAGHNPLICWNTNETGSRQQIQFGDGASFGSRGSITTNGGNVIYGGTSDYRKKQDDVLITDGIEKIKLLKPKRFKWKTALDLGICDGFFAHEVQEVVPTSQAVTGTKDEVDSDGNPVYQQMDQSKLVPLLTAALQEAITKIETLETKVAALEAA